MKQVNNMNPVSQLKKMPAVLPETGELVGQISDVIIHPTEGIVLGLILQSTKGLTCAVAAQDFFIFNRNNVVAVLQSAISDQTSAWEKMAHGISVCHEAIGTKIVTENGKYIGYVSDVVIVEEPLRVVYQVIESFWQKYFGRELYISADLPFAWSRDGTRFIVREDDLTGHLASCSADAIISDGHETAAMEEKSQKAGR
jgi:sporulation protein YlmC with PRC-barrel domain